jgi:hypothetical protein
MHHIQAPFVAFHLRDEELGPTDPAQHLLDHQFTFWKETACAENIQAAVNVRS